MNTTDRIAMALILTVAAILFVVLAAISQGFVTLPEPSFRSYR